MNIFKRIKLSLSALSHIETLITFFKTVSNHNKSYEYLEGKSVVSQFLILYKEFVTNKTSNTVTVKSSDLKTFQKLERPNTVYKSPI